MPAASSVKRGLSSTAAAVSSSNVGVFEPHGTSRSVTSAGGTPSFASATQRAMKSSTVCCASTPFTAEYRAPATSMRFTHTVTRTLAEACGRASEEHGRKR
jgi:hypothetical protein